MICTLRDQNILKRLGDFGVLTTAQVAKDFFPNTAMTTVRRRMRALEKAEMIYRVDGLDFGGVGWALTKNAAKKLGQLHGARRFSRNSLKHDVALSEVRNVLEKAGLARNWVPEHVLKTKALSKNRHRRDDSAFVPDAIFSLKGGDRTRVVALEVELHAKSKERYETILSRYKYKNSLSAIWYLVTSEALGISLESIWRKVNSNQSSDKLLWSHLSEILQDPLSASVNCGQLKSSLRDYLNPSPPALGGALRESGASDTVGGKQKLVIPLETQTILRQQI